MTGMGNGLTKGSGHFCLTWEEQATVVSDVKLKADEGIPSSSPLVSGALEVYNKMPTPGSFSRIVLGDGSCFCPPQPCCLAVLTSLGLCFRPAESLEITELIRKWGSCVYAFRQLTERTPSCLSFLFSMNRLFGRLAAEFTSSAVCVRFAVETS